MTKKFAKSVSFNEKNETDLAILKHVARRNFSGYVKKLITEDMKRKEDKKKKEELEKIESKPPLTIKSSGSEIKIVNSGNLKLKD
jgi:hypothetical protein